MYFQKEQLARYSRCYGYHIDIPHTNLGKWNFTRDPGACKNDKILAIKKLEIFADSLQEIQKTDDQPKDISDPKLADERSETYFLPEIAKELLLKFAKGIFKRIPSENKCLQMKMKNENLNSELS